MSASEGWDMVVEDEEEGSSRFGGFAVKSVKHSVSDGFVIGLYGEGGIGKTTLAASIASSRHAGRILHINARGGPSAISHLPDIEYIQFKSWYDEEKIYRAQQKSDCPFTTFIWDNLSEMYALDMEAIVQGREVKMAQIQDYGKCMADVLRMTRRQVDLAAARNFNIIFILWEENDKDEISGRWKSHVAFPNRLAAAWPGVIPNFVGQVQVAERKPPYRRKLSFLPTDDTAAKACVSPGTSGSTIPLEIFYKVDDPVLADIIDVVKGDKKWPTERYVLDKSGK